MKDYWTNTSARAKVKELGLELKLSEIKNSMKKLIIMLGIILSSALTPISDAELYTEDSFETLFVNYVADMPDNILEEYIATGITPVISMTAVLGEDAKMTETMKLSLKRHFLLRGIILSDNVPTVREERWAHEHIPSVSDWQAHFEGAFNVPIFNINRNQILKAINEGHYHKIVAIVHHIYNGWCKVYAFKAMNFLLKKYEADPAAHWLYKVGDRHMTIAEIQELGTFYKEYKRNQRDVDRGLLAIEMKEQFAKREWRKGILILMDLCPEFDIQTACVFTRKYYYRT